MEPLLSICIPIYNRQAFLKRMLERFLLDKSLFCDLVYLYISDNCSEEDIEGVCKEYQDLGLRLKYHRNKTNLGMDGNFVNCFMNAQGKYLLLLGSDDVPEKDFLTNILPVLKSEQYGLIHLMNDNRPGGNEYDDYSKFLEDINVWITFISSNIVSTKYIQEIDFSNYTGTMLSQVPLYLQTAENFRKNIVLKGLFFQGDDDSKRNSGYNLFQVFVVNLLGMIKARVELGKLTEKDYNVFKRLLFRNIIAGEVNRRLLFHKYNRLETSGGWKIVLKYYGKHPYMYYYMMVELLKSLTRIVLKKNE